MKQHKWHKEIKAWADGAEIESRVKTTECLDDWIIHSGEINWDDTILEYRIKPQPKESRLIKEMKEAIEDLRKSLGNERIEQPKEPKYLYVYQNMKDEYKFSDSKFDSINIFKYIAKIKLEDTE